MTRLYAMPGTKVRKPITHPEHDAQVALVNWANTLAYRWPALGRLFAIPNAGGYTGGFKANVNRVKQMLQEGLKKGVCDLMLPVPTITGQWLNEPNSKGYSGLFIEMKAPGAKTTDDQNDWLDYFNSVGYYASACWGCYEAQMVICQYLGIKPMDAGVRK